MEKTVSANIWGLLAGSGPVVKLVLLILLLFSLVSWTIILAKAFRFYRAKRANDEFADFFDESDDLLEIYTFARTMQDAPMAGVFYEGYYAMKRLQATGGLSSSTLKAWLEILERGLKKGIQEELAMLERFLPFLATTTNAAPFIGLFGTVWGIMTSFHAIGLMGNANLATVAPGISEALVATAAGLAAAIPAGIAFNTFTSSLSQMEADLEAFSLEFLNIMERQLISAQHKRRSGVSSSRPAAPSRNVQEGSPKEFEEDGI